MKSLDLTNVEVTRIVGINLTPWLLPVECSEKEFQAEVIRYAKRQGWKYHHHTISRKSSAGWPDLAMCRMDRLVFAELKVTTKPTADQLNWLEWLRETGNEVYLWRPEDWPKILEVLK